MLDLFCGAGGAAMGYHWAGFDVVGVDIAPQPHYPFEFHQADALTYPLDGFDAIHASPPCQAYSVTRALRKRAHPMLVEPTRELLQASGLPWVMENVVGAPLANALVLCGTMFEGLRVYRHRLFECDPPLYFPPLACNHSFSMPASKGQYHTLETQDFITAVGHNFSASSGRIALGIDWMTRDEMAQAIPPAYTEWIGRQLLSAIEAAA
ncbi:MAG TPA: DNA cytosine methyltransferase [Mycobacteriales bacterium]|nr:DNA cytosine methyltransferase [Mycobacteriales bacterium]